MRGVFLDRDSVDSGDLDLSVLEDALDNWQLYATTATPQVAERIAGAEIVVSNKVPLTADTLAQASELRLICVAATGTNNVDLAAATELGIAVCNVRGYATPAVVQHVFALILALSTRLPQYQRAVAEGRWQRSPFFCLLDYPIREIAGKHLGIVGFGELGRGVARVAEAFGMRVSVAARPGTVAAAGRVALAELLRQVDILSLHCPLTAQTRGLIGAEALALMKPDALLINTARGGIIDESALAEALREGKLGGAGIDVVEREPPAAGDPLLAPDIPNLILTPHIAWASRESRQRLLNEVAENIRAYHLGQIRNQVA
ncbi:MAG: glycerate dehydrogenase [Thiotrichales bacterium SG8_50]|nr:MAG: glycerate dehydrogenase [Thiotrichales bacterium SG8_50]